MFVWLELLFIENWLPFVHTAAVKAFALHAKGWFF